MLKRLSFVLAFATVASISLANVLVDQDPSTGPYGGAWQDITGAQILADSFNLSQNSTITEYDFFSIDTVPVSTYTLSLFADSGSNAPGATLLTIGSLVPTAYFNWGSQSGQQMYEAQFTGLSINVSANTLYWINISGDGSDAALGSTNPSSNGDGTLSFESTPAGPWQTISSIGDVTYELQGTSAPEPASMAVLGVGALALIRRRFRK